MSRSLSYSEYDSGYSSGSDYGYYTYSGSSAPRYDRHRHNRLSHKPHKAHRHKRSVASIQPPLTQKEVDDVRWDLEDERVWTYFPLLHPISHKDNAFWPFRVLVLFGIISPVYFFIVIGILGTKYPNYMPKDLSVSTLAAENSPEKEIGNALIFGVTGALIMLYAIALFLAFFMGRRIVRSETQLPRGYRGKKCGVFVFVIAIFITATLTLILTGVNTNDPNTPETPESTAHNVIAGVSLLFSGVIANIALSLSLRNARDVTWVFHVWTWGLLAATIAFFVAYWTTKDNFGLWERLAFATAFAWQITVAIFLLTVSCARPCPPCTRRPLPYSQRRHDPVVQVASQPTPMTGSSMVGGLSGPTFDTYSTYSVYSVSSLYDI